MKMIAGCQQVCERIFAIFSLSFSFAFTLILSNIDILYVRTINIFLCSTAIFLCSVVLRPYSRVEGKSAFPDIIKKVKEKFKRKLFFNEKL